MSADLQVTSAVLEVGAAFGGPDRELTAELKRSTGKR
jgi:hypothetical protein